MNSLIKEEEFPREKRGKKVNNSMFLLYLWDGGWQAAMYWPIAASGNKKSKRIQKDG